MLEQDNSHKIGAIALAVLIISLSAPAFADAPINRYRGEELFYSVELFGQELARGAMIVSDLEVGEDGREQISIFGMALTEGFAEMVYPMHDEGSTQVDPQTGLPFHTHKTMDERGRYREYTVDFEQDSYEGNVIRVREDVVSRYMRSVPGTTHDAMSWLYAIRSQELTPGTTAIYYVFDGWKLSRVTATVRSGRDNVLVGDEYVSCRVISLYREVMASMRPLPFIQESANLPPTMWVQETRSGEQMGDLWISDDDRRLPVQIEFQNELITATARLDRFTPPH